MEIESDLLKDINQHFFCMEYLSVRMPVFYLLFFLYFFVPSYLLISCDVYICDLFQKCFLFSFEVVQRFFCFFPNKIYLMVKNFRVIIYIEFLMVFDNFRGKKKTEFYFLNLIIYIEKKCIGKTTNLLLSLWHQPEGKNI